MAEFSELPEAEQKLLQEVAKAKNITVEALLHELGYLKTEEPQAEVFEADTIQVNPAETAEFKVFEEEVAPPPVSFEINEADIPPERDLDSEITTLTKICPYCGWDQELPVLVEPNNKDKQGFLQSILGQKVFVKSYSVLGGKLDILFRGLTLGEIDACYQSASRALKTKMFAAASDYYEYVNRLRMSLQFIGLISSNKELYVKLPDGLDRQTNPTATIFWDEFLKTENLTTEEDLVVQVQTYIVRNVLTTEHLQRIVTTKCTDFNRLVSRLEVSVNDENFWNEIELPS